VVFGGRHANFFTRSSDPCSFCGVPPPQRDFAVTTAKPGAVICDVCLGHCAEIYGESLAALRCPDQPDAFKPPPLDAQDFLPRVSEIISALNAERATRGTAFLRDVLRMTRPEAVRDPVPTTDCSFCSHPETTVAVLVTGRRVWICEGCVVAAVYVYEELKLRQRYGWLYDELIAILVRHDPISINFETNTDEYKPEVRALLERLETCQTIDEVGPVLHEIFVAFFDEKIAGPRSVYDDIARDVWRVWEMRA
jgi:hypothetical protein